MDHLFIDVVDARTGQDLERRWTYHGQFYCVSDAKEIALDGQFLYFGEHCSERVARFPRGGAEVPTVRYAIPDRGRWIGGPSRGMLFFATEHNQLLGVRLEGGQPVRLNGVDMPTGPPLRYEPMNSTVSRVDTIDDRIYAGQKDGAFRAFDIASGKHLFTARTRGHGFGRTRKVGDYLVVETEGEVVVLKATP